jgi:hypothetical protein
VEALFKNEEEDDKDKEKEPPKSPQGSATAVAPQ